MFARCGICSLRWTRGLRKYALENCRVRGRTVDAWSLPGRAVGDRAKVIVSSNLNKFILGEHMGCMSGKSVLVGQE